MRQRDDVLPLGSTLRNGSLACCGWCGFGCLCGCGCGCGCPRPTAQPAMDDLGILLECYYYYCYYYCYLLYPPRVSSVRFASRDWAVRPGRGSAPLTLGGPH